MTKEFKIYKKGMDDTLFLQKKRLSAKRRFNSTKGWYLTAGRKAFIEAFQHETKISINERRKGSSRVESGIPTSPSDLAKKIKSNNFYAVHAEWFLQEVDKVFDADTKCLGRKYEPYFVFLNALLQKLFLDSLILFANFSSWHQGVNGFSVFGVGKNNFEHPFNLFHATLQSIYGTYSPLSFSDNHADASISLLRTSIELRLRYGFGTLGIIDTKLKAFIPLPLSELISNIIIHQAKIELSIPISNIDRIYKWANLYMHGGFKLYTWCAPASLDYLRPLLLGGKFKTGKRSGTSAYAGIKTTKEMILKIQKSTLSSFTKKAKDPSRYQMDSLEPNKCQAVLS